MYRCILLLQVLESEELLKSANKDLKRCLEELKSSNSSLTIDYDMLAEKVGKVIASDSILAAID